MVCTNCQHFKRDEKHTYKDKVSYGCSKNGRTFWTNDESLYTRFGCVVDDEDDEEDEQTEQMNIFDMILNISQ